MNAAFLALLGIVVGIGASFAGLGGGFLVVPLLIYVGFTPQKAVGTSFLTILVISLSAVFAHGRLGSVDWRAGLLLGIGGIAGAQIGARLLQHVDSMTFNRIFALILFGLGAFMLVRK